MSTLQSKIGIGTVQFGTSYGISNLEGKTPKEEVAEILDFAKKNAIQYIDTAYAYGNAEEVIGNFDLSSFRVVSKYIPLKEVALESQFHESLKKLNTSNFYGYLAHRPSSLTDNNKSYWNKLQTLKEQGLVAKIGASFNKIEELERILDADIDLDIIQVPYNYFDRRFEKLMKDLKKRGCEIHTRSAFLQGLFFCKAENLNPFFNEVKNILYSIQTKENKANQLLKFVLEKEFIDVVNIGVNNKIQLKENIVNLEEIEVNLPEIHDSISTQILMPSEWPK